MATIVRIALWLVIPLVVLGAPAELLRMAASDRPAVVLSDGAPATDIRLVEAFWKRYDPRRMPEGRRTTVSATAPELDAAIAATLAFAAGGAGRAVIEGGDLVITATGRLPKPFDAFGPYVNARARIVPSEDGLAVSSLELGRLRLPSKLARPVLQIAVEALAGGGAGEALMEGVRSVRIERDTVQLAYLPPAPDATLPVEKTRPPPALRKFDPHRVRLYYEKLDELARRAGPDQATSLTAFIQPLFRMVAHQSEAHDPLGENAAAIAALALYFGDARRVPEAAEILSQGEPRPAPPTGQARLEGRHEFVSRFLDAAATVAAGGRPSDAPATGAAGSKAGFSFTDIAAARAGRRFAATALASKDSAIRVQRILSGTIGERDLFPPVLDLPEGLTESEFKERYGDRKSAAFTQVLTEIDRRIESIPLYR